MLDIDDWVKFVPVQMGMYIFNTDSGGLQIGRQSVSTLQ